MIQGSGVEETRGIWKNTGNDQVVTLTQDLSFILILPDWLLQMSASEDAARSTHTSIVDIVLYVSKGGGPRLVKLTPAPFYFTDSGNSSHSSKSAFSQSGFLQTLSVLRVGRVTPYLCTRYQTHHTGTSRTYLELCRSKWQILSKFNLIALFLLHL